MEIIVDRIWFTEDNTIGEVSIDGYFECYSLEDKVREIPKAPVAKWKVAKATAIPAGRYEVVLSFSNRFKKTLPELLSVPGFSGVRMHAGNTEEDTEGCILLGRVKGNHAIYESRPACIKVVAKIAAAIKEGKKVFITLNWKDNSWES